MEGMKMNIYEKIANMMGEGHNPALVTILDSEKEPSLRGKKIIIDSNGPVYSELDNTATGIIAAQTTPLVEAGDNRLIELESDLSGSLRLFMHIYRTRPRLIIYGGGHVGAALCRIAAHLDFEVVVIDDRPAFANDQVHPTADRLICDTFDRAFQLLQPRPDDFLVIVTRGHRHDRFCLEEAIKRDAAYVGMIGSRSRVRAQLTELAEAGYSEETLAAVHTPIGLTIGAVTEAEIAISILAEIIQVRRKDSKAESIQVEVLKRLQELEESGTPAVLATIVKSLGSTPRKTGSQLIVYRDGSITGTIGGGCAEGEVRRQALLAFDQGLAKEYHFSLTADVAADEGMACGGTMDLFLELINGEDLMKEN